MSEKHLIDKARRLLAQATFEEHSPAYAQGYRVALQDLLGDEIYDTDTAVFTPTDFAEGVKRAIASGNTKPKPECDHLASKVVTFVPCEPGLTRVVEHVYCLKCGEKL